MDGHLIFIQQENDVGRERERLSINGTRAVIEEKRGLIGDNRIRIEDSDCFVPKSFKREPTVFVLFEGRKGV